MTEIQTPALTQEDIEAAIARARDVRAADIRAAAARFKLAVRHYLSGPPRPPGRHPLPAGPGFS